MNKQLPKNITEIYEPLHKEVLLLHAKREIYRQLYNSGDEVINLLNFASSNFFVMCRDMLINDMLIAMRRLIDREKSKVRGVDRDNLSLSYLASRIDKVKYPKLIKEVEHLISEAKKKTDFAKDISNRRIAHNDLLTKLKVDSLPPFNMKIIDDALHSIEGVMNKVIGCWGKSPVIYRVVSMPNDANTLVTRLRQAKWYCIQLQELDHL